MRHSVKKTSRESLYAQKASGCSRCRGLHCGDACACSGTDTDTVTHKPTCACAYYHHPACGGSRRHTAGQSGCAREAGQASRKAYQTLRLPSAPSPLLVLASAPLASLAPRLGLAALGLAALGLASLAPGLGGGGLRVGIIGTAGTTIGATGNQDYSTQMRLKPSPGLAPGVIVFETAPQGGRCMFGKEHPGHIRVRGVEFQA